MLDLAEPELDIAGAELASVVARLLEHLVRHIDADHAAGRADLPRRQEAIEPRAAAEIDHGLAGLHRRDRQRVAAAEAEIGTLRHRRELLIGVALQLQF